MISYVSERFRKRKRCWGVISCIFFAGQQNGNTPAPHSALFFFNLTFLIFDTGVNKYIRKAYPQDVWVANRVSPVLAFILSWAQPLQVNQEPVHSCPFRTTHPVGYVNFIHMIYDCLMIDTLDYTFLNVCIFQCSGSVPRNHWQHCMKCFCFVLFCFFTN